MRPGRQAAPWLPKLPPALIILLLAASWTQAADDRVLNLFLVQNSGWMEPFYLDPNSKFKPLIETVIEKVTGTGDEIVLASFNQSIGENQSPLLVYRGGDRGEISRLLKEIKLARKPGDNAYADTDFREAVVSAITRYTPGRPSILWIFTNNKNSPKNSPETAAKNKEFYDWLKTEGNIKRIEAWLYPMQLKGPRYQAEGMMVYALAYGEAAEEELEKLNAAKLPFGDQPARLKPLNADAITFVPTGVGKKGNFSASLGPDSNTLVIQFDLSSRPEVAEIYGVFRNDFYPYDIVSADVALDVVFTGESHGIESTIEPGQLTGAAAGKESSPVVVKIAIPALPGIWRRPEIIFKNGYQVPAVMKFSLVNQKLQLSPDFMQRINGLFPGDPLPEIFLPDESAQQSVTTRPLLVRVEYPTWPLVVLALLFAAVFLGGSRLAAGLSKPKKYVVSVDGMQKKYSLKVFGRCVLYSADGDRIGTLRRGLGKPTAHLEPECKASVSIL